MCQWKICYIHKFQIKPILPKEKPLRHTLRGKLCKGRTFMPTEAEG